MGKRDVCCADRSASGLDRRGLEDITPLARANTEGDLKTKLSAARGEAEHALAEILEQNNSHCQGLTNNGQDTVDVRAVASVEPPLAVIVTCTDCEVNVANTLGSAGGRVITLRSRGNVLSHANAAAATAAVAEKGVSLAMVVGHSHCAAVELGISRWLERTSARAPDTHPPMLHERRRVARQRPQPADDSSVKGIDRACSTGSHNGRFLSQLFQCYIGADMAEDESHHSVRSSELSSSQSSASYHGGVSAGHMVTATNDALVDTIGPAIQTVAADRLKQQAAAWRDHHMRDSVANGSGLDWDVCAPCTVRPSGQQGPEAIEAPRAPRRDASLNHSRSADALVRQSITRDTATASSVVEANAKLAAQGLLRSIAKKLGKAAMGRVLVVAAHCDVDTGRLRVLQRAWVSPRTHCYYYQ